MRSRKQNQASNRNWIIRQLRGAWWLAERLKGTLNDPDWNYQCNNIEMEVDALLKMLQAETESDRVEERRKERTAFLTSP